VLARLALEVGLPPDEVTGVLAGDRFASRVREDEERARLLGIGGVPFFVFDERYGVSGARSVELLVEAFRTARSASLTDAG
jgi:predicted DsbA family dithiol-disulfide isomerase